LCLFLGLVLSLGCGSSREESHGKKGIPFASHPLEILFAYGSEKQPWIEESTNRFHSENPHTDSGRPIRVKAIPMGSGETIQEILEGRLQAHLVSPASGAFILLGNAESRAKTGRDLVASTDNLVLSPVVIAMWRPMAEALGWGRQGIGWRDILSVAKDPTGWAGLGHPEWGRFKFGHTHPGYSNSGLISLLAELYAGCGQTRSLTLDDLRRPAGASFLEGIEASVVHYGSSTGFFARKLVAEGPSYLSAAVLYESSVIESTGSAGSLPFPLVAVYPREGTFWSDHPAGIVEREWVTQEHRKAAQAYIRFLLARPQQERALAYGFRPADPAVPLGAPIDRAHGVDPAEPKTTLQVPSAEVMHEALGLWAAHKKLSQVILALDISGSMKEESKWDRAREGAKAFLSHLGDRDLVSVTTFNNKASWLSDFTPAGSGRVPLAKKLDGLYADGGTALYDTLEAALARLNAVEDRSRIQAVVVLSDGDDRDSRASLEHVLQKLRADREREAVRVFTIGYGKGARTDILKSLAEKSGGRFYEGKPENIREVFKEISTFF
jgi:Ca-activated chloride channel family protein